MIKLSVFSSCAFILSCNAISNSSIEAVRGACNGLDPKEIRAIDDISEDCKKALSELLPQPENSLVSRLFAFNYSSNSETKSYIVAGINSDGSAITTESLNKLKVYAVKGNEEVELDNTQYSLVAVTDSARNALSVSTVVDYSGSMGKQDIDEISSLFLQISNHLLSLAKISVVHFSKDLDLRQEFSTDRTAIEKALQYNETIKRGSTSLYDAMGQSVSSLSKGGAAGRVLIVATDGHENSSKQYSKEKLKTEISSDKRLVVLMIGTFLADAKEMREIAGERGAFVYANTISKARRKAIEFSKAINQGVEVKLSTPLSDVTEVRFKTDDLSVSVKL